MGSHTSGAVLLLLALSPPPLAAQIVRCDLTVGTYGSGGPCALAEPGATPRATYRTRLARFWPEDTARVVMTSRPSDPPPWRGVLLLGQRQVPFEIDRYGSDASDHRLILRNAVSWSAVHDWRELRPASGATPGAAVLVFGLTDFVRASPDDIAILESALAGFGRLREWDRDDDRNCANDRPGQTGLFCLLAAAVEARMGRYHHRQPALELIRVVIIEKWPDRLDSHPLMDFNNHPTTTAGDVVAALEAALSLARAEAASSQ
jgi:hypothetical protein